jgi:putative heme degradation protein
MAKVMLQLIDDSGKLHYESVLIADMPMRTAVQVMADAVSKDENSQVCGQGEHVTEFHYTDGDVGAYDDVNVQAIWSQFTNTHQPSHILIRPNTDRGQSLSNQLHAARKMESALQLFVDAINATGGVVAVGCEFVPAGDKEWFDLGDAYTKACEALGKAPLIGDKEPVF